jgi:hypothetical protein
MRGKAIGFVMLICATWTTARVLLNVTHNQNGTNPKQSDKPMQLGPPLPQKITAPITIQMTHRAKLQDLAPLSTSPERPTNLNFASGMNARPPKAPERKVLGSSVAITEANAQLPYGSQVLAPNPSGTQSRPRPLDVYAYSFWRAGNVPLGQLGNGQYGGSQSAILLAVPMRRFGKVNNIGHFAIIGRVAVSHGRMPEREWAAGLRWQPIHSVPAHVSIEKRFRPNKADAVAAYVAGGHEGALLPMGFALDGYGQAGFVTGKQGGVFVDAQWNAQKMLAGQDRTKIYAGGGIWGGGQDTVMRLDLGPSARAVLPLQGAQLRIDASWRFRIAGDAQPGDGPAITLSTNF